MTITREKFYGRASKKDPVTSGMFLSTDLGRVKELSSSSNGQYVVLPDARQAPLTPGGPVFYLINIGSHDIAVKDFGEATVVGTVKAGEACTVLLKKADTANGKWAMRCRPYNTGDPFTTTTTTTMSGTNSLTTTASTSASGSIQTITGSGSSNTFGTGTPFTIKEKNPIRYVSPDLVEALAGRLPESKKKRTVSLVMAELNEGPDLEITIESALLANRRPSEVIVVDDCSHRSPSRRLRSIISRGSRIILLENQSYLGCGGSRHIGCQTAKGEVVIVCDSHMLFPHQWLGKMLAYLEEFPNAILCSASTSFAATDPFYGTGARLVLRDRGYKAEWLAIKPEHACPRVPAPMGACYMLRREVLEDIGGWGPGLRGWGLDEEYLALRAWMLGYEVRVCVDVPVGHNYLITIDRSTRCGARPDNRAWEVLYNQLVVARVVFEDGGESLYNSIWAGYEHLRESVESRLAENEAEIERARTVIQKLRILSDDELLMRLQEVEHDVAAV